MKKARNRSGIAMALMAVFLLLAFAVDALAFLDKVGPTSPDNGFPMWYRDRSPATLTPYSLELCLETNLLCILDPALDLPVPGDPVVFPTNFPEEVFFWFGRNRIRMRNGNKAQLIMALEGGFLGGPVKAGDQITFARVRIRLDAPVAGTYVVTHPYGRETFKNVTVGKHTVNFTRDIGIGQPGDFTGALKGDLGPFLVWDPITEAPAGYIGDPAVGHIVSGSPKGTNYFEVVGPPGSNLDGLGSDVVRSDLFEISGKLATRFGVTVDRATYTRDAAGATTIEVMASSAPGQTIDVNVTGLAAPVSMLENPDPTAEDYFVRFALPTAVTTEFVPAVTVTNRELNAGVDAVDTVVTSDVADIVTVAASQYQITDPLTGAGDLVVNAASSDLLSTFPAVLTVNKPVQAIPPTITSAQFNTPVTFVGFAFPSPRLTLKSSKGGTFSQRVPIADAPVGP